MISYLDLTSDADWHLKEVRRARVMALNTSDKGEKRAFGSYSDREMHRATSCLQAASKLYERCSVDFTCEGGSGAQQPGVSFYLCDSCNDPDDRLERILDGCTCGTADDSDHAPTCEWTTSGRSYETNAKNV